MDEVDNRRAERRLAELMIASRRVFVLTGAGCSTDSGIPDYRDGDGAWKRKEPMRLQEFVASDAARRRYWARSFVGWPVVDAARPSSAHAALAGLERSGRLERLVTQNVDGLHQRAGSRRVLDLHGRLDEVECLDCGRLSARGDFQEQLAELNPGWRAVTRQLAPDGDVDLAEADYADFRVPDCAACGGVLKPAVVFFGEQVPKPRVQTAMEALAAADLMLVVGSSLMVWSGYRFVREAVRLGVPVAAVNLGRTRADNELTLKVRGHCGEVLGRVC